MLLEAHVVLFVTARFFQNKKKKLPQKWGNWPKIGFFEFIENFSHSFFLNLVDKMSTKDLWELSVKK